MEICADASPTIRATSKSVEQGNPGRSGSAADPLTLCNPVERRGSPTFADIPVTVCICTRDRPHYLASCLDGLRRQSVDAGVFRTIIVDSASRPENLQENIRLAKSLRGAELVAVSQAGVSLARNRGLELVPEGYIVFVDDDAIPAPDWIASLRRAVREAPTPPAVLGGSILPLWEAPLPAWWPAKLRGVLSLIEANGTGEFGAAGPALNLEPYGANMALDVRVARLLGGFHAQIGRDGMNLLSDEETSLADRIQAAGYYTLYDSRIRVLHQVQAVRLRPEWLLSRMYWQGRSRVYRLLANGRKNSVRREVIRRMLVAFALSPLLLLSGRSASLIGYRWRLAYSWGFLVGVFTSSRSFRTIGNRTQEPIGLRG